MNKHLKVGMIGAGGFGSYRREKMRESGLFELVSAYDLKPDAMTLAQREDGARPVSSYEELLDTPGIEAVIISTGAKYHAEQAITAMERGLHVFVEKPLCSTPQEVDTLVKAQRRTGVVVGVGHSDHSGEARSQGIKKLLDDGKFGKLVAVEATTAHSGGLEIKPGEWRGDPDKNPGGMLFQCGVHKLHELMFYFGPIVEVLAWMRYDVHTTKTADTAQCLLRFKSGLTATLNAYHITPYRHTLSIFGTDRNLYWEMGAYGDPDVLVTQRRGNCTREPREPLVLDGADDACGNLRSFYRAVREGGEPYPSLLDGARAVAVVFAAEESARTGRPVMVPYE
jgi:UDP-N-acetyl-2-amino-2-deoxyglucuronate dehydrogenase